MSYPFSINKNATVHLDEKIDLEGLIKVFNAELNKLDGTVTQIDGQTIKIIECKEFSSRWLRTMNLNRGRISFTESNRSVIIKSRIILVEHIIIFSVIVVVFGGIGTLNYNAILNSLPIVGIMLTTLFVFCYLFPLNTYYSFFNETIRKILYSAKRTV